IAPPTLPPSASLRLFRLPAPTERNPLSLHDALPIFGESARSIERGSSRPVSGWTLASTGRKPCCQAYAGPSSQQGETRSASSPRSEEHTSELQSRENLVCRLLLEKKNQPDSAGAMSS